MTRRLGVAAALVGDRLLPGDVTVGGDRITAVGVRPAGQRGIAAPGLIDLQVNGYDGVDVATADAAELARLRRALARDGVTAVVPTVITGEPDATLAAVARLGTAPVEQEGGARLLGTHVEGPWISPDRLGTHPAAHRRDVTSTELERLTDGHHVVLLTLAPELRGALDAVRELTARGVAVLLGHSNATAAQAAAAFDAGAAGVTHLFNAMAPMNHRDPGLVGVALTRPDVTVGLIADGHHLARETVALVFAAARGRVALVTDATAAAGRPDGVYDLAGVPVTLRHGAVRNTAGDLAGSAATLAGCVRETVACGVGIADALRAASTTPAALLTRHGAGPDAVGRLFPGARADVTVFDDELDVTHVLIDGKEVRSR